MDSAKLDELEKLMKKKAAEKDMDLLCVAMLEAGMKKMELEARLAEARREHLRLEYAFVKARAAFLRAKHRMAPHGE